MLDENALIEVLRKSIGLQRQGRFDEAESIYDAVLAEFPDQPDALNLLGLLRADQGDHPSAERLLSRAIEVMPQVAEFHNNLGSIYNDQKKWEPAERCYRQALRLQPAYPEAHFNLGNVLLACGRIKEAAECYRNALEVRPGYSRAWINLSAAFGCLGNYQAEEACAREGLKGDPTIADGYFNLGDACQHTGKIEEAFVAFATAILKNRKLEDKVYGRFFEMFELSPWTDIEGAIECARRALVRVPSSLLQSLLACMVDFAPSTTDISVPQKERREWYRRFMAPNLPAPLPHSSGQAHKEKLRIGYIPGRFRRDPSCYAFSPMLLHYDKSRFEVHCYSGFEQEDDLTQRIRENVDGWRSIVGLGDEETARMIHRDGIDILVDLFGHAGGNHLPIYAWKPAPIQVTAWGHANGTGMPEMDYLFSDPVTLPENERHLYAETILDLPCVLSYWCPEDAPPVAPAPALRNGRITFGCFNRSVKVSDEALDLWARLLAQLPQSRLLLKGAGWEIASNRDRVGRAVARHGVDPGRIRLLGASAWKDHLAAYAEVDIALDTLPMGGGVTTLDTLWMGVPVVCMKGGLPVGRATSAIVKAAGLADWVAKSREEYVGIALDKSANATALASLRASMRERVSLSPLANPDLYVRIVEHRYHEMWQRHCGNENASASGFSSLESLLDPSRSGLNNPECQSALTKWARFLQEADAGTPNTL